MTCARTRQMLDAWLDRELDPATSEELAQHLATCPSCAALQSERDALRKSIKAGAPYFHASQALRQSLTRSLAASQVTQRRIHRTDSWWQLASAAGLAAVASSLLTAWMLRAPVDDVHAAPWREQFVALHVAGLHQAEPVIEVASSDRHAIKPWFQGRLDFAPTVADLAKQGFVLRGARLEHLEERPAAAVVYQLRGHYITLFMTRGIADEPLLLKTLQGFNVATWSADGVRFVAVADTDTHEIERFAQLVQKNR